MATASTSQSSSYCPYVSLAVSASSSTGGATTYAWTLTYNTVSGLTMSTSQTKTVTATIGGTTVYNAAISVNGKTTYTIATGSLTISKSTSAKTITASVSIAWGTATWSGTTLGTRSGSTSWTLAAKTSYTISFSANGGSGAPSAQTKWYGTTLTLSTTKPTRSYYTFSKWNTNSSGTGTSYSSGGSYTANAAATLYAVWTGNTYTITYDANGGENAPSSTSKQYGATGTITTAVPTRANYNFLGWATSSDSTTVAYASGASLSTTEITANTTLYAVWELAHVLPGISGLTAFRCDEDGVAAAEGEYASVSFSWAVYDGYEISSITITEGETITSLEASGTSGTVSNQIIGVSMDATEITIALTDTADATTTTVFALAAAYTFIMGFTEDGTGVAFGKVAETPGTFDVDIPSIILDGYVSIVGSDEMLTLANETEDTATWLKLSSWAGTTLNLGIGSGGYNIGLYDEATDTWLIRMDESGYAYLPPTTITNYVRPSTTGTYQLGSSNYKYTSGYFSSSVHIGSSMYSNGLIELFYSTPYIDFHYGNNTSDYTHRIIASTSSGNLVAYPGITSSSDERLKHDIVDIPEAYTELFDSLLLREYRLNKGEGLRIGVIAQEVRAAEESLGIEESAIVTGTGGTLENGDTDYYAVDYNAITIMACAKIRQLEERIAALEEKLAAYESGGEKQ